MDPPSYSDIIDIATEALDGFLYHDQSNGQNLLDLHVYCDPTTFIWSRLAAKQLMVAILMATQHVTYKGNTSVADYLVRHPRIWRSVTDSCCFCAPDLPSRVAPSPEEPLQQHPCTLGVQNGVVDLTTGTLRDRTRDDYIFTVVPHTFDPNHDTTHVQAAMEVACGGAEEAAQLRMMLSDCITGDVARMKFYVLTGDGRHSIMDLMRQVLGDFYVEVNPRLIVDKRPLAHTEVETMKLRWRRLARFDLSKPGVLLDPGVVKSLAKGLTLSGKTNRRGPYTRFEPTHKCVITSAKVPKFACERWFTTEQLVHIDVKRTVDAGVSARDMLHWLIPIESVQSV